MASSTSSATGLTTTGGANGLGIPGLNSGLDTTATIAKIMQYEQAPVDSANQQIQIMQWKEAAYRTQNTALSTLNTSVFNLTLQASYSTKTINSSNNQVATATAASTATNGTYSVSVTNVATYATNTSTAAFLLTSQVTGSTQSSVKIDNTHDKFQLTFDGQQQTIDLSSLDNKTFTAGDTSGSGLTDLVNNIQSQLDSKFNSVNPGHTGTVNVKLTSTNQLEFYTNDGAAHNITVNDTAAADKNSVLNSLGFTNGQTVANVDTSTSLYALQDQFTNSSYFTNNSITSSKNAFSFSINGQAFNFTYNDSIDSVVKGINSNSAAGVNAYYDTASGKLMLTATKSGDYNHGNPGIVVTDTDPNTGKSINNGVLSSLFNISQAKSTVGADANFQVNGTTIKQSSNTFSMNGVTFNLTGAGSTTVGVASDTSAIVKQISDFVTAYNTTLSGMYTQINQSRPTNSSHQYYLPLTSTQKSAMSADDITQWTTQAQEGLLNNDSLLLSTVNEMRSAMSRPLYMPTTLTGSNVANSTNIDATSNQFTFTLGDQTKQIKLDSGSYSANDLKSAVQQKLDAAFGSNRVQVSLSTTTSGTQLVFSAQNTAMSLSSGTQNNGLAQLGFADGASVNSTYSTLSQIGITTGDYSENGALHLDTTKLTTAIQNDPDGVLRLFTNSQTITPVSTDPNHPDQPTAHDIATAQDLTNQSQGIFTSLHVTLTNNVTRYTDEAGVAGSGDANTAMGTQISTQTDRVSQMQDRLTTQQNQLWTMFNNMETVLGKLNTQSSMLTNLLSGN